jgi:hypothetical protein
MVGLIPYKWIAIAVAIVAALAGLWALEAHIEGIGYDKAAHVYQAAIDNQKADASATLASETERANKTERALQEVTNTINLKDSDHEKTVADLSDRLRRAAGPAGRLRDPHAAGCGRGGGGSTAQAAGPAGDRPADAAEATGLLSADLTELLQRITRDADHINDAYTSCREQGIAIRAAQ